jgi:hypothetical protein
MKEIKTTVEWAFFLWFIGGIILVLNAIFGLIFTLIYKTQIPIVDGTGFFVFSWQTWGIIVGSIFNLIIGFLALFSGLKLFSKPFYNLLTKIDVAVVSLVMIFLGLGTFTIGGLLLFAGGIFGFLYRLSIEGANNKKAK